MIRFYSPDIESSMSLPASESQHCCRVLRMSAGDEIEVTDGKGYLYRCEITDANPKDTALEILEKREEPRHWLPRITIAVAPTKNIDRMEWLVEKSVEIGVDRIVFLDCHNSVRRVAKTERFERVMISAMKQSLKSRIPEFTGVIPFKEFIDSDGSEFRYMGYCDPEVERREFARVYHGGDLSLLIGPEGDFTREEVEYAIAGGFIPVTFGNVRLRTETAALYALCAAHTILTQID